MITKLENLPKELKEKLEKFLFDESPLIKINDINNVMFCLYEQSLQEGSFTTNSYYILKPLSEFFYELGSKTND